MVMFPLPDVVGGVQVRLNGFATRFGGPVRPPPESQPMVKLVPFPVSVPRLAAAVTVVPAAIGLPF